MTESIFDRARPLITRTFIESEFACPGSFWERNEYKTLNPMRDDQSIGSFSINADNGKWFDFAEYKGGDIFDLIAARDGINPADVARNILGEEYVEPRYDTPFASPFAQPTPSVNSPSSGKPYDNSYYVEKINKDGPKPDWKPIPIDNPPRFHKTPDNLTLFYSSDGIPQYWVIRFNADEHTLKRKNIYPCYWTGTKYIASLPPNLKERTLLPFERDRKVVLLEGERKTEMARSHDKSRFYSYTCWHGGAAQADRINLEPLRGLEVVLFPDNDEASLRCFKTIANRLNGIAKSVDFITPGPDIRNGYDIADYIEEKRDVFIVLGSAKPFVYEHKNVEGLVPDKTNFTDLGNAERFVSMYKDKIHYNMDKNRWMIWNGLHWDDDDPSAITPLVKKSIRSIVSQYPNDRSAFAHAMNSEQVGRISGMLSLAAKETGIPVKEDNLDTVQHIIIAPNGQIDLRTGELSDKPNKEYLCSKMVAVPYNKDAKTDRFKSFLDEIMEGDKDRIEFLQRWFGYSLTGDVSAQSFLIMYGTGANGKSTLVELIARISGGYARSAPPDTFVVKQAGGVPNDIAALRGARIVLTTETEANARLAESKVKYMTGGDRVSARFMRAEFFEFNPQWKIIISTNHRPRVSGGDFGIWRRVLLLPFKFQADGDKLDQLLPFKLWDEREGVFAWMVEGAKKWYADGMGRPGLKIPKSILIETQEYRVDEDLIGRFVSEECLTGMDLPQGKGEIEAGPLYRTFVAWAEAQGERFYAQMTQTMFGRAMRERGFESFRSKAGRRCYRGIYPIAGMTIDEENGGRNG